MNRARWVALAAIVLLFAADRLSKLWIEANVSLFDSKPVITGVFHIVHTKNSGAAFGLFNDAPSPLRTGLLVVVSGLVTGMIVHLLWQATRPGEGSGALRWALTLVLGGALGNLHDRIRYGFVTDFLQVFLGSYEWPSFNVADSAISVGAVLMAVDILITSKRRDASETHPVR